jgi:hypothetical protein
MSNVNGADRAIRLIDELLSGRKLQPSARKRLKEVRSEIVKLKRQRETRGHHVATLAVQWSLTIVRLFEAISDLLN